MTERLQRDALPPFSRFEDRNPNLFKMFSVRRGIIQLHIRPGRLVIPRSGQPFAVRAAEQRRNLRPHMAARVAAEHRLRRFGNLRDTEALRPALRFPKRTDHIRKHVFIRLAVAAYRKDPLTAVRRRPRLPPPANDHICRFAGQAVQKSGTLPVSSFLKRRSIPNTSKASRFSIRQCIAFAPLIWI